MQLDFSLRFGCAVEPPRSQVGRDLGKLGADPLSSHLPMLRALARALVRNDSDAQDLVQETCVRALGYLARRDVPPANFEGWLRVILRRAWLNELRAARAHVAFVEALSDEGADRRLEASRVSRAQLRRILARVPPKARGVVCACLLEGEARADVAARTGLTPEAIDASIYRARLVFRSAGLEP